MSDPPTESRRTRQREWLRTIGTLGSGIGGLIAACTFIWGFYQFSELRDRWQKDETIRTTLEINSKDQSFISFHCISAFEKLDDANLVKLHKREPIELNKDQIKWVMRCFSDKDVEGDKLIVRENDSSESGTLTRAGVSLLAVRVNMVLDRHQILVLLRLKSVIDDKLLLPEVLAEICDHDIPVLIRTREFALKNPSGDTEDWKILGGG